MIQRACLCGFLTILLVFAIAAKTPAQSSIQNPVTSPAQKQALINSYSRLPLTFVKNEGQTAPQVNFTAYGNGYHLFLTPTEAVFTLKQGTAPRKQIAHGNKISLSPRVASIVRMQLRNANPHAKVSGSQRLPGKVNYIVGRNPANWHQNIATYARVRYESVYPGVDLAYYGNQKQLEYDFIVAPHADPKRIALSFEGAQRVHIEPSGELSLVLKGSVLRWKRPVVYQEVNGHRKAVAGRFVALGRKLVGFQVARYEKSRPLVIDPQLVYCTFLGGAAFNTFLYPWGDLAKAITADSAGCAYITGDAMSTNFPVTNGAFQTQQPDTADCSAFVSKLSADGTSLVYSTYLGGSGYTEYFPGGVGGVEAQYGDFGVGIAVDSAGCAYVAGATSSTNFPVTQGAFQTTLLSNLGNAFVTKLSADGTSLVYSTYLGGSGIPGPGSGPVAGWSDSAAFIAVDSQGSAYITGYTDSTDFPVTQGAYQATPASGFFTKLSPDGKSLVYSTYMGTTGDIFVDGSGFAYLAQGNAITKFKQDGSGPVYSTPINGSINAIARDAYGYFYLTGSPSANFQATPGAYQTTSAGGFVMKLAPDGKTVLYATFVPVAGVGIVADVLGNAYITGEAGPNYTVTKDALPTPQFGWGSINSFLTVLNANGSALVYSTLLAGGHGYIASSSGIAIDGQGCILVTGSTNAYYLGTTPGAFQTHNNGFQNGYVMKVAFPTPTYFFLVPSTSGAVGAPVLLRALLKSGVNYTAIPQQKVNFTVNGMVVGTATTSTSGEADLLYSLPNSLNVGTYTTQATYGGNYQYKALVGTGTLTVFKCDTTFTVTTAARGARGQQVQFTIRLVRLSDGKGIANKEVAFAVEGTIIGTASTDAGGVARVNYTIPSYAPLGWHGTQVFFDGDGNYNGCNGIGSVTVTN